MAVVAGVICLLFPLLALCPVLFVLVGFYGVKYIDYETRRKFLLEHGGDDDDDDVRGWKDVLRDSGLQENEAVAASVALRLKMDGSHGNGGVPNGTHGNGLANGTRGLNGPLTPRALEMLDEAAKSAPYLGGKQGSGKFRLAPIRTEEDRKGKPLSPLRQAFQQLEKPPPDVELKFVSAFRKKAARMLMEQRGEVPPPDAGASSPKWRAAGAAVAFAHPPARPKSPTRPGSGRRPSNDRDRPGSTGSSRNNSRPGSPQHWQATAAAVSWAGQSHPRAPAAEVLAVKPQPPPYYPV